jgi:hypothetical protein
MCMLRLVSSNESYESYLHLDILLPLPTPFFYFFFTFSPYHMYFLLHLCPYFQQSHRHEEDKEMLNAQFVVLDISLAGDFSFLTSILALQNTVLYRSSSCPMRLLVGRSWG